MAKAPTILVVEDNPVNLELFADVLAVGGYECIRAVKGEDALELAKTVEPDLVLLDIQLPGMDGLAVVRHLRNDEATRGLKVVALTAYALKGDREAFLEQGFDGYIAKPITVKEFLEAVGGYLQ